MKIHFQHCASIAYKRYHTVCNRPVMKDTFLEVQRIFTAVSRLRFEGFSQKSKSTTLPRHITYRTKNLHVSISPYITGISCNTDHNTLGTLPTDDFSLVSISQITFTAYLDLHSRNFLKNPHLELYVNRLQTVSV